MFLAEDIQPNLLAYLSHRWFAFTSKSAQWVEQYDLVLTMVRVVTTSEVYHSEFPVVKQFSGMQCSSFGKSVTVL